jgi:hypothetical protein
MKFTIRDAIWATTVIALVIGWYLDRRVTIDMFDGLIRQQYNFKHMGGYVPYGKYVPIRADDDRIRFELESERMVARKLETLKLEVHQADGGWIARVPEVSGIMASGKSREEAVERVRMVTALVLLNGRRVYFPMKVETRSDELFPDIENVLE